MFTLLLFAVLSSCRRCRCARHFNKYTHFVRDVILLINCHSCIRRKHSRSRVKVEHEVCNFDCSCLHLTILAKEHCSTLCCNKSCLHCTKQRFKVICASIYVEKPSRHHVILHVVCFSGNCLEAVSRNFCRVILELEVHVNPSCNSRNCS